MADLTKLQKSNLFLNFLRSGISLAFLFLLIEFFDELNYGVEGAALPALRTDLGLSYFQVGILLGLPGMLNTLIEPFIMLLGDTRLHKRLVIGGGLTIAAALLLIAGSHSFLLVLLALIIAYPASGAFVSLVQATLMDLNPGREAQMMARWTVAGSTGNLLGPLLLAGIFALGMSWRWAYVGLAVLCLVLTLVTWPRPFPRHQPRPEPSPEDEQQPAPQTGEAEARPHSLKEVFAGLAEAVRNPRLLRWMLLLQLGDLLLDGLIGYLPLYFTDVMRLSLAQSGLLLSALMLASLVSNIALVPLLEKLPGRWLVRRSAAAAAVLYIAWLLVPWLWVKIALIILLKLVTLGWYEVLQGEAYASAPGRSGTVMAINSVFGLLGSAVAWLVGFAAAKAGLPAAMWLLLAGPLCLVFFVPRVERKVSA